MAELEGSTALAAPSKDGYSIQIVEHDAAGKASTLALSFPADEYWGQKLRRAALAKQMPSWAGYSYPLVLCATEYADSLGLDILAGDVYIIEGRLGTTAEAKIKRGLATGRIVGIEGPTFEDGEAVEIPWETKRASGVFKGTNVKCTLTLHVEGWKTPYTRSARLREWFKGENPNWRERPEYMLYRNLYGKMCEELAPMGTAEDEAPPLGEILEIPKGGKT